MHYKFYLALSLSMSAGCSRRSEIQDRLVDAEETVRRYVVADLNDAGMSDSISALFINCPRPGTDRLEPVRGYTISRIGSHGDTVVFVVRYAVLGYASSLDASQVGPKNWSFTPGAQVRADTFRVVPVRTGSVHEERIVCGGFPGNRVGLEAMSWYLNRFDEASLAAWNESLRAKSP